MFPVRSNHTNKILWFLEEDKGEENKVDEFLTKIVERFGQENVRFTNAENASVQATLQTLNLPVVS
ncbi:MAG: hypothetical protein AAB567_01150 [Patescibacteria group bacterium]